MRVLYSRRHNLYGGTGSGTTMVGAARRARVAVLPGTVRLRRERPSTTSRTTPRFRATFRLVWCSGADLVVRNDRTFVNFKPLQMYNNASEVSGTGYSSNLKVAVGQLMNLQVQDPSGLGGIVVWSMPGGASGSKSSSRQPSKLTYLSNLDLLSFAAGGNISPPPLSLAWVPEEPDISRKPRFTTRFPTHLGSLARRRD